MCTNKQNNSIYYRLAIILNTRKIFSYLFIRFYTEKPFLQLIDINYNLVYIEITYIGDNLKNSYSKKGKFSILTDHIKLQIGSFDIQLMEHVGVRNEMFELVMKNSKMN